MPRLIKIKARPQTQFDVPYSDGYSLYSAILSLMKDSSVSTSEHVHDSDFSSLSISSLDGSFQPSEKDFHKQVTSDTVYEFQVGVTDEEERDIFQTIVEPLLLDDGTITLTNGTLQVQEFSSVEKSYGELLDRAQQATNFSATIDFKTPTCIQYKRSDVTEMFPHRVAVFYSLLTKWNQSVSDELKIDIDRDDIGANLIEKPDLDSLETHSVVVNRVSDEKTGKKRNIIKQGFTGECKYKYTGSIENKLSLLR